MESMIVDYAYGKVYELKNVKSITIMEKWIFKKYPRNPRFMVCDDHNCDASQ